MEWFLHSGTAAARLARTLVEVLLSWLIANLGDIFGFFELDPTVKALIISGLTVLITAILGFINDNRVKTEAEIDEIVKELTDENDY